MLKLWSEFKRVLPGIFFGILSLAGISALAVASAFLTASMIAIGHKAEEMEYFIGLFPKLEENYESAKDEIIFTPLGDMGVGWIAMMTYGDMLHGHAEAERVSRQALNRLEGQELLLFLQSMESHLEGYQSQGEYPANIKLPEPFAFSDEEHAAITSCLVELKSYYWGGNSYEKGSWEALAHRPIYGFRIIRDVSMPYLGPDTCSLAGKIAIK